MKVSISVLLLLLLFLLQCSHDVAGTIDETQTGIEIGLYGKLVDGRNGEFAENAFVEVYNSGDITALDTTYTDSTGLYIFDSLADGTYDIHGLYIDGLDTLYALIRDIVFDSVKYVGIDTLNLPGSIKGLVSVEEGEASGIFCYIPGTSYLAITDIAGNFEISSVPPGTHFLTYMHAKYRDTTISGVKVLSNKQTVVPNMMLYIDSTQKETLIWGTLENNFENIVKIEAKITGDGIAEDSPIITSLSWLLVSEKYTGFVYLPQEGLAWDVEVMVYDSNNRVTGYQKMAIDTGVDAIVMPTFDAWNAKPIPVASVLDNDVSMGDTLYLKGSAFDSIYGKGIVKWEWDVGNTGNFVNTTPDSNYKIVAPLTANFAYECVLCVTDDDINNVKDTVSIIIRDPDNPFGMKLIASKDKTYRMGNESDYRIVTFTYDFFMDTTEVIQKKYFLIVYTNPSYFPGDSLPVEQVTWYDAVRYCVIKSNNEGLEICYDTSGQDWVCDITKHGYRLPTEAEWEFACRAGSTNDYFWGVGDGKDYAWYNDPGGSTHEVALKKPNNNGLYDIIGNVFEYCNDWYSEFNGDSIVDPVGPLYGDFKICRGGSWKNGPSNAYSWNRAISGPNGYENINGFRVVITARH